MVLTLLNVAVGAAQSAVADAEYTVELVGNYRPRNGLAIEANFNAGNGDGTTADAYVQTSLDGGSTWIDIAQFHFTTSSAKAVYNLTAKTPVTTQYTPTDGTLSSNTCKDGILGDRLRVKWASTGTYTGSASLTVTAVPA